MSVSPTRGLANRRAVRLADVDTLGIDEFRATVIEAVVTEWRIVAFFGMPEDQHRLRLLAILADDERGELTAVSAVTGARYPSLTPACPQASRFERELSEQCGVIPEGHPWLKAVRRHPPDHSPSYLRNGKREVNRHRPTER